MDLAVGDVTVGLIDTLPVSDVTLILGNDIAGSLMVPKVPLNVDKEQRELFQGKKIIQI